MRSLKASLLWSSVVLLVITSSASADVIFESATLNHTGSSYGGSGPSISNSHAVGVRFQIIQEVQVTAIGGHIVQAPLNPGTFFGAIISLDSLNDVPTGSESTAIANISEVIGSTVFRGSYSSTDLRTPLSLTLHPGYYALVFGTNALGASSGDGEMPITGQTAFDNGLSTISWPTFHSPTGRWSPTGYDPYWPRFVIEGYIVPEPASVLLFTLGGVTILRKRNHRLQRLH